MSNDPRPNPAQMAPGDQPMLAVGVRLQADRVTAQPVLLFPEGLIQLNPTGAAIVELCDGHRSLAEIVAELARRYNAPPEVLFADVAEYLGQLRARRHVVAGGSHS